MADPRSSPSSALIVDDEHGVRELLVLPLGRLGWRTDTAANLAAARAQLTQHSYDLCLTDMRLPDGSGIDLVAATRAHHPNTPPAPPWSRRAALSKPRSMRAGPAHSISSGSRSTWPCCGAWCSVRWISTSAA